MNKHLLIIFVFLPFYICAMEQESLYRRIAISANKKDVATDLTFEQAEPLIEMFGSDNVHLKYKLKAFGCTYLRRQKGKTYNQMKAELDSYYQKSGNNDVVKSFITIMKAAIDNWDTQNPENIFKYTEINSKQDFMVFLTDPCFLGLKDPREKDKQQ